MKVYLGSADSNSVRVEHPEALKQLAAQTSIPIALGERLYHRWDAKPFFEAGLIDILQPDIAHAGGISETKRLANMAETYDVAMQVIQHVLLKFVY